MHLSPDREAAYPNLTKDLYQVTSEETDSYNCVAFAAGVTDIRWEPDQDGVYYWPPGVKREYTIDAFMKAFESIGYEECEIDPNLDPRFDKIAIYQDIVGTFFGGVSDCPTHAAVQMPNGKWKSKLGNWEDIEHATLDCLNGDDYSGRTTDHYGQVVKMLRRPRKL